MNCRISRFLPVFLLALVPLAPLYADHGSNGRPHGGDGARFDEGRMDRLAEHQAERLTRALDLTPEQQVTLGRLQEELENSVRPLGETKRTAREQLRTLLDSDSPDPAAVGTQAIAIDRSRDAMHNAWKRFETGFTASLSATQRSAYRVL
ncbi:MAG: periplasmic heavy metal sensor, partial [Thermoanaerobaculia bacterium]